MGVGGTYRSFSDQWTVLFVEAQEKHTRQILKSCSGGFGFTCRTTSTSVKNECLGQECECRQKARRA